MTTILCDTCTIVWLLAGDQRLSTSAGRILRDPSNHFLVSTGSWVEASSKTSRGLLPFSVAEIRRRVLEAGFAEVVVVGEAAEVMERLPRHHLDPFDRLLIAQARLEQATILTPDPAFQRYDIDVAW